MFSQHAIWVGLLAAAIYTALTLRRHFTRHDDMIGATFIRFDCRGCMAHDQRFEWVGIGDRFEQRRCVGVAPNGFAKAIVIKIIKHANAAGDYRDADLGETYELVDDGKVQRVAPRLYLVFG